MECFSPTGDWELDKMWRDLCGHDGIPKLSPPVYQHVDQTLYSDLIMCHLSTMLDDHTSEIPILTPDEDNILRYAAG